MYIDTSFKSINESRDSNSLKGDEYFKIIFKEIRVQSGSCN